LISRPYAALIAAFALVLVLGDGARGQTPVTASTIVDRNIINIGDPIKVSVVVAFEDPYTVAALPALAKLGDLDVLDTLPLLESKPARGMTRWTFRYFVTSFRLGDYSVPSFELAYSAPDGAAGSVVTTPIAVRVRSVVQPGEDATDIKPLKPQLELAGTFASRFLYWGGVFAAILAVATPALLLYRALRRRRRPVVAFDPERTPAQVALRELKRIADLRLPESGRHDEHYELLGRALRRYLADQFGIPAAQRTARELRAAMDDLGIDRRQATPIHEILRESEAVRFQRVARHPRHGQQALAGAMAALAKAVAAERPEIEVAL
jgi:hypothetical protein